jgi:uncharacterized membrane protein YedE/YeeE
LRCTRDLALPTVVLCFFGLTGLLIVFGRGVIHGLSTILDLLLFRRAREQVVLDDPLFPPMRFTELSCSTLLFAVEV